MFTLHGGLHELHGTDAMLSEIQLAFQVSSRVLPRDILQLYRVCINFRIAVLTISIFCVFSTVALAAYMFHYRKIKVFKVASPIFLMICLVGCVIMYLEMAAIFPILDMYACIATKWTRHMGWYLTQSTINKLSEKSIQKFYDKKFKLMILSRLCRAFFTSRWWKMDASPQFLMFMHAQPTYDI